jgi:hypothetical protein
LVSWPDDAVDSGAPFRPGIEITGGFVSGFCPWDDVVDSAGRFSER